MKWRLFQSVAVIGSCVLGLVVSSSARAEQALPDRPLSEASLIAQPRNGSLTPAEWEMAKTAWLYFQRNVAPDSGLANSADNFPSTTMWDTASYLAAVVAARGLGLIEEKEAVDRLGLSLATLQHIQLFRQECPNKAYDTNTVDPTNYRNKPGEIGCSALDMGRLMVWLKIIAQRYPQFEPTIALTMRRWNMCAIAPSTGVLYGAAIGGDGATVHLQEGRLGYEEYGALAYRLWGFDAGVPLQQAPSDSVWLYGVEVPYDSRDPRDLGAHNYVVTESYALLGMEFGWKALSENPQTEWIVRAAQNVYEAQRRRYLATGILTARTEHQLGESPYFVYDTLFSDGTAWATITEKGVLMPEHAAVAVKSAVSLWALWDTPYSQQLFDLVATQFDPAKGFFEGIYEDGRGVIPALSANNNGVILEALLFKAGGTLLWPEPVRKDWSGTEDQARAHCLPYGATN